MSINFSTMPAELKAVQNWVCWTTNKMPIDPKTGNPAAADDPATWTNFETAANYAIKYGLGIGFEFGIRDQQSGIVGIDIDHCRESKTGQLSELATNVVSMFSGTYVEISPSGTGLHIYIRGLLPKNSRHKIAKLGLELYESGRYFTVTGNMLPGAASVIRPAQSELDEFYRKYFARLEQPALVERPQSVMNLSDADLVDKILKSKQGVKFQALFNGDTSSHGNDDSSADLALCNMLAFWTGRDPGKIDTLFRQSGLFREKWDRPTGDSTYGAITIQRAISDCQMVYDPEIYRKVEITIPQAVNTVPEQSDKPKKIICECFSEEGQFIPPILAEEIMKYYRFAYQYAQLFVYDGGVYRRIDSKYILRICLNAMGDRYRDNRGSEVAKYIITKMYSPESFFANDIKYINTVNGLLDWQNGQLYDHTPEFHSNIQIPVKYNPAATCPVIEKFFADVLPEDCMGLVFEIFGYFLIPDVRMQKAFLLKSGGESGKSVFLSLLQEFLGRENYASEALQALADNRFRAANLAGKLANIFADIPNAAIEDSSIFKALVTGDEISAERKNKDPFSFRNTARLIFSCNELPRTKDNSHGFFRRWIILSFPNSFPEGSPQRDPYLLEKLVTPEELSGLLNLSIAGLKRLMQRGEFGMPESCKKAVEEYIFLNDSAKAFLNDCVEVNKHERIRRSTLFDYYRHFCTVSELRPVRDRKFNEKVREFFPTVRDVKIHGIASWVGLKIVDPSMLFTRDFQTREQDDVG